MDRTDKRPFNLDALIMELRSVSQESDAASRIRAIFDEVFANPQDVAENLPDFPEDDVVLFEDDHISIWHCRFPPGIAVPPHDHQVSANIGVYAGTEKNSFYKAGEDGVKLSSAVEMTPGSVLSIGPSAIHSVVCISKEPSCGIHVYTGPLTRMERSLFDTKTGKQFPFTDEAYEHLKGQSSC